MDKNEEEIDEIEEDDGEEMGGKVEEEKDLGELKVAKEDVLMAVGEEEVQQNVLEVEEDVAVETVTGVLAAEAGREEEAAQKEGGGGDVEVDVQEPPPPPPPQALVVPKSEPSPARPPPAASTSSTQALALSPEALANLRVLPPSTAAGAAAIARSLGSPVPLLRPQPQPQNQALPLPYPQPWQQQEPQFQPANSSPPPAYSDLPPSIPAQGHAGPSNYMLAPLPPAPEPEEEVEVEKVVVLSEEQQAVLDMVMSGKS